MEYIFKLDFVTDGDFGFDFVPCNMKYDGYERYWFEKTYNDYNIAVRDIKKICEFLKNNISGKDCVAGNVKTHINTFICNIDKNTDKRVSGIFTKDKLFHINTSMYGNYEGTEFTFYTSPKKVCFEFLLTEEEEELYKKNVHKVTYGDIKKAVLELFERNEP